ncbi:MAG TPA: hypothetical protein PK156_14365, partial [Polyangium sp.]|nr:hypothetical protein [Polyangium sp.]
MKTSRSSRLAKRCALLFVPAIPFVLGANEDGWSGSEELPPIPRPYASSWQIGCKNVQFETNATEIADFDSTSWCTVSEFARPKYHANADPRCTVGNKGPAFYVADGKLYSRDFSRSHDLAPLFGGRTPNAPSAPIVTIPGTTLVYVFFGYAPQADTEESPRAFFMVFDAEKFRDDPSQTWIQGLFPLDIGSNENAGCGTIHLATVASDAEHPNHATVFVSTCRHAYGFHIAPPADGFSRERFFREEISADRAKQNTHHRAEMEVLAMNGGYAVFWPFERNNGKPAIAVTRLPQDGVPTHKTLTLDFGIDLGTTAIPFIKGLEIARDWRSLYVTWPGAPNSLFQFKLFEPDG